VWFKCCIVICVIVIFDSNWILAILLGLVSVNSESLSLQGASLNIQWCFWSCRCKRCSWLYACIIEWLIVKFFLLGLQEWLDVALEEGWTPIIVLCVSLWPFSLHKILLCAYHSILHWLIPCSNIISNTLTLHHNLESLNIFLDQLIYNSFCVKDGLFFFTYQIN